MTVDHDILRDLLRREARRLPKSERARFSLFLNTLDPEFTGYKPERKRKVHSWHKKPRTRTKQKQIARPEQLNLFSILPKS